MLISQRYAVAGRSLSCAAVPPSHATRPYLASELTGMAGAYGLHTAGYTSALMPRRTSDLQPRARKHRKACACAAWHHPCPGWLARACQQRELQLQRAARPPQEPQWNTEPLYPALADNGFDAWSLHRASLKPHKRPGQVQPRCALHWSLQSLESNPPARATSARRTLLNG